MAKAINKQTPMMVQYEKIKAETPGTILFFRMGDFYEMFLEDAKIASKVLGLTLTSRSKGENAIPMAGVPYHAVDRYMKKLIAEGYRVAICDQTVDPATVKGLVPREVTRVVTPGTLTDEASLEADANNFLAAAAIWKKKAGIAYIDLSTGEFFLEEASPGGLANALERISPAETLLAESLYAIEDGGLKRELKERRVGLITPHPDSNFSPANAPALVKTFYGVATLDGFGIDESNPAVGAASAVLRYLHETQRGQVRHILPPKMIKANKFLVLDHITIRNLELTDPMRGADRKATIFHIINRTSTAPGARLLRSWLLRPLAEMEPIRLRQEAGRELREDHLRRGELRELLSFAADIERIIGRVGCLRASPRDLFALGNTLRLMPELVDTLAGITSRRLQLLGEELLGEEDLTLRLTDSLQEDPPLLINAGGIFRNGVNPELDELREIRSGGKDWIARYQASEAERTGISSLKVKYNKVFGYYIEITKRNLKSTPEDYQRKQTLVNAERFTTPQLSEYETKVVGAEEKIVKLENSMFMELLEEVAARTRPLQRIAAALAEIDVYAAFGELAAQENYNFPEVEESCSLQITEGRHPVLAANLPAGEFVPNDLSMEPEDSRFLIITGPNMAGKSTYIRQCAIILILAQMGAPIPATQARIGLSDRVFTRVGAADDLSRGQSTFMVEMSEAANIINNATENSFIVIDELGRGTSTFDGVSLAWSLTEYIHNHLKSRCLFATHYHELAELGVILSGAANYNIAVRDWDGEVIFLHHIQPGSADRSYGIHVARLAGIPHPVLERAKSILSGLELQALERDTSILGETEALRAAAGEMQMTLFDDPERDRICKDLAALDLDKITDPEALKILSALQQQARRWQNI